jgi:PQQ-dependent dehydrogenase (methanol/ethanol family)
MRLTTLLARLGIVIASAAVVGVSGARFDMGQPVARAAAPGSAAAAQAVTDDPVNWPMHNLDLRNSRFAALDSINTANVGGLVLKWSFDLPRQQSIGQVTPLVVDGLMYFNSGSQLFALDAATGKQVWVTQVEPEFPGTGRGPVFGGGRIYAYGLNVVYAVDARTGAIDRAFGNEGRLLVADAALRFKYPEKDALGYQVASPPAYHDGTLYFGLAQSEGHIPGGLVVAVNSATGAVKWVFNTVPQGPADEGWAIARDTWQGGARAGGGMWTAPAIDAALGLLYVNAGNPSPDYDGSARKGVNLFTNSILALRLNDGTLAWYYQAIHHDLWDWDLVSGPVLFDVETNGRTIKGVASAGKNCLLYMWNRESGQPLHAMVETAVPTASDVPGEAVWPVQPMPYTARGVPMQPFCATYPILADSARAARARQMYHPYSIKESVIVSHGGSSFGSPAFSPRTGLLYVTGKNAAISITVRPVGDTLRPSREPVGHSSVIATRDNDTGVTPSETVTAYNPATGELVWQHEHPSRTNISSAGNLATAGDIVFQGSDTGAFYALDARSGRPLFTYTGKAGIRASPLTYRLQRTQYVSVVASSSVLTFGLP